MVEEQSEVVILGDGYVGKTSILHCMKNNEFEHHIPSTYDAFEYKHNEKITVKFIDTAGQEEYELMRRLYYKNATIFLLCFATDDIVSFENLESKWIPELKDFKQIPIILVGTKSDLRPDTANCVSKDKIMRLRKEINAISYIECSAKTKTGINDLQSTTMKYLTDGNKKQRSCVLQ